MPTTPPNAGSPALDALFQEYSRRLDAFEREAEAMLDRVNERVRKRASSNLDNFLKKELRAFAPLIENAIAQLFDSGLSKTGTRLSGGGLSQTALQLGADLLKSLEQSKRNL